MCDRTSRPAALPPRQRRAMAAAAPRAAGPGGRRLMITDLVLENFKSYAGTQAVGPFHKVRRMHWGFCYHSADREGAGQ